MTGTIALDYDDLDRLTSESSPRGSVTYGYDNGSRRTSMTVAGQPQVSYGYDDADRPSSITQGSSAVAFTYDAADRRTSLTLPNGITTTYEYDAASQLIGLTYQLGGTKLGDLSYSYDIAGRRITTAGTFARTGIPGALSSATYNANNQLIQRGGITFTYDENGNLIGDSARTYTWDARNQLASITGGVTASFQYDPVGRRITKSVSGAATSYLYDGANLVQELAGSTPAANMLPAGLDEVLTRTDASGARTFLNDTLGSTVALADSAGSLQTQYTYDPFGQTTQTGAMNANPEQFTGRENDGTGLFYYRARYYNPTLGRFISEDPIEFGGADSNLYAYAFNDPINTTDPTGEIAPWLAACVGGAAFDAGWQLGSNLMSGRGKNAWDGVAGAAALGCATGLAGFGAGKVLGAAFRAAKTRTLLSRTPTLFSHTSTGPRASAELIDAIRAHGRTIKFATEGSEELRYLNAMGAEANVGGPGHLHILLRENPSKAAALEEFLHGTQSRLGIIDRAAQPLVRILLRIRTVAQ
jgi:RHS repeat-associated protein